MKKSRGKLIRHHDGFNLGKQNNESMKDNQKNCSLFSNINGK